MEVVLNKVEEKLTEIDKQLCQFERLNNLSKKVNIRVSLLVSMMILFGSITCFVIFGPSLLANIVGVLYPVYHILNIIDDHSEIDYIEIITYWLVFGILYIIEEAIPSISYYLPFFYPFKVSLLIACISSDTNFSALIYDTILAGYCGFPSLLEVKKKTQMDESNVKE